MIKTRLSILGLILLTIMLNGCSKKELPKNPIDSGSGSTIVPPSDNSSFKVFKNNGLIKNAADPFVFKDDDGTYYLYHTGKNFKVYSSKNLIDWNPLGSSMPNKSYKWAVDNFWAPEVVKFRDAYYMHYTGEAADGVKRIGIAKSESPTGPFVDISDTGFYGTPPKSIIDSHLFFDDDGKIYMYYSNAMSSNKVGNQNYSEIWVIELKSDLSGTLGAATKLIQPQQDWEYSNKSGSYWNEGAVLLKNKGVYYLMYSANCYCNSNYSVGYATSKSPLGPFVKYAKNPILSNETVSNLVSGPGHHTVTKSPDNKELLIIYHSHMDLTLKESGRMMNIDRMGFREDGTMYVNGPTVEGQLYPSSDKQGFEMIGKEATVSSQQTKGGFQINVLTDGEFTMYQRFADYEWVATGNKATISFEWQSKQTIKEIWLYNSIVSNRQVDRAKVLFDDGTEVGSIGLNKTPGKATVIKMPPNISSKGFKLMLEANISNTELGLSEVDVLKSSN